MQPLSKGGLQVEMSEMQRFLVFERKPGMFCSISPKIDLMMSCVVVNR